MANVTDPIFDYDDSKEREALSAPVYNYDKARASVLKLLDRAKTAFESATPLRGRQPITIKNGHVELHLPFAVNEKASVVRSSKDFADTLASLYERVKEGVYDEAIKLGLAKKQSGQRASTLSSQPRKKREWSEEQRKSFAEAIARRKAANTQ